jgi:two-component system response regulator DesR
MNFPVRILCIDDNRLIAEALERRLATEPRLQWVGWVSNLVDAAGQALQARPDVVLLDIDMPGRDSFDVLREIAATLPSAKIVMLSGHVRLEYVDRAIDAGAWGYLSKNESMEDLFAAIMRIALGEFVLSAEVEAECRERP